MSAKNSYFVISWFHKTLCSEKDVKDGQYNFLHLLVIITCFVDKSRIWLFWILSWKTTWTRITIQVSNGILIPKLFWPAVRKKCFCNQEKLLKFEAECRGFAKIFEITRTIYSNSERSEQFFVTECSFNLFLEVSHI